MLKTATLKVYTDNIKQYKNRLKSCQITTYLKEKYIEDEKIIDMYGDVWISFYDWKYYVPRFSRLLFSSWWWLKKMENGNRECVGQQPTIRGKTARIMINIKNSF